MQTHTFRDGRTEVIHFHQPWLGKAAARACARIHKAAESVLTTPPVRW